MRKLCSKHIEQFDLFHKIVWRSQCRTTQMKGLTLLPCLWQRGWVGSCCLHFRVSELLTLPLAWPTDLVPLWPEGWEQCWPFNTMQFVYFLLITRPGSLPHMSEHQKQSLTSIQHAWSSQTFNLLIDYNDVINLNHYSRIVKLFHLCVLRRMFSCSWHVGFHRAAHTVPDDEKQHWRSGRTEPNTFIMLLESFWKQ